jgi:hypothetical protein
MSKREQISHGRWSEYLDQVSAGNRGRRVSLDVVGQAEGVPVPNAELSPVAVGLTDAPFLAIGYDPVDKGNAIVISAGANAAEYEHRVEAPVELAADLDDEGRLDSLEIVDQNGARTKLNFFAG